MKLTIKLIVVALVVNACARAGMTAMSYYRLKDATQQLLLFGGEASVTALQQAVLARAAELELPLQPEDVVVTRAGTRTWAEAAYVQEVELFPRYRYPVALTFSVETHALTAAPVSSSTSR